MPEHLIEKTASRFLIVFGSFKNQQKRINVPLRTFYKNTFETLF